MNYYSLLLKFVKMTKNTHDFFKLIEIIYDY